MVLIKSDRYEPILIKDYENTMNIVRALCSEGDDSSRYVVVVSKEDNIFRIDYLYSADIVGEDKIFFMDEEDAWEYWEKHKNETG